MKKLVVLVLTVCMVLAFTSIVLADNGGNVYVDYMLNGNLKCDIESSLLGDSNGDFDASLVNIGFDYLLNNFKFGAEYRNGTIDASEEADYTVLKLMGGYRVIDNDSFKLDIKGEYNDVTTDLSRKLDITGISVGANVIFLFENAYLEGSLGYSLSADAKSDGKKISDVDVNLYDYRIKYTYLFTDKFGVSAGYSNYVNVLDMDIVKTSYSIGGFTLGATYHF